MWLAERLIFPNSRSITRAPKSAKTTDTTIADDLHGPGIHMLLRCGSLTAIHNKVEGGLRNSLVGT